jgi:hemerythrin
MTSPLHLGDAALDQEHQDLQAFIEGLLVAPAEDAPKVLVELREHAAKHFTTEDADLIAMKGGNSQCHLDEHAAVLRSLDEVRAVLEQHGVPPSTKAALVQRLAVELRRWLPEHVREMDAGVATFRLQRRFGGSPVRVTRR